MAVYTNPDVKSYRHRADIVYQQRALHVLAFGPKPERFLWIVNGPACEAGHPGAWRPGILAALGRIEDDETLRKVARDICRRRPKVKDAITRIRHYRTGHTPRATVHQLAGQIVATIQQYADRHTDTEAIIAEALRLVRRLLEVS
jgi:hypothetical protein